MIAAILYSENGYNERESNPRIRFAVALLQHQHTDMADTLEIRHHPSPDKAPRVAAGCRIYAIGDIHGRADLLRRLHGKIAADMAKGAPERLVLVYLGDYVDRGPDSFEVIDLLINDPIPGFEAVYLKGNHEDFLLRFIDAKDRGETWLMNGAPATLASYGIDVFGIADRFLDMEAVRDDFQAALPASHLRFLRNLTLSHRAGDYLFVHAGIRPDVPVDEQDPFDMMWIRDEFLCSGMNFGVVVVHGHSQTHAPESFENRIGIDTGAYRSGVLTCLVLEGGGQRFLHT